MPIRKPNKHAKQLRKDMPPAERKLWARIRARQLGGFRFRRQHSIGPYIADFASVEVRIVIELDGAHDHARDAFIESEGWSVLRFWNNDAYGNIDGVLETILDACETEKRRNEFKNSD